MISIRSEREIELLRTAGQIVYETHQYLKPFLKEGISTKEIDDMAAEFIKSKGAIPSCKGYQGYPANICISINDEVVHGIPGHRTLKNGDIVKLDIGACYEGYHGDSAWSYIVLFLRSNKAFSKRICWFYVTITICLRCCIISTGITRFNF